MAGSRSNAGKEPWRLLPFDALNQVVRVLQYGTRKYAARNWEQGLSWAECGDSMQRHWHRWFQLREDFDDESGLPHLAHIACNAVFMLAFQLRGTGTDDRPTVKLGKFAAEADKRYQKAKESRFKK